LEHAVPREPERLYRERGNPEHHQQAVHRNLHRRNRGIRFDAGGGRRNPVVHALQAIEADRETIDRPWCLQRQRTDDFRAPDRHEPVDHDSMDRRTIDHGDRDILRHVYGHRPTSDRRSRAVDRPDVHQWHDGDQLPRRRSVTARQLRHHHGGMVPVPRLHRSPEPEEGA